MLVSTTTIAAVALVAFGAHFERPLLGSAYDSNTVSITRTTAWSGGYSGTATAVTDKGNELQFGADNFDIRNGGGNWNDCVVFDASKGNSRLWNKTELYGITSIKIFGYNKDAPDSYANLSTASFTFFYGYETIDFDDEHYVAKQTTSSGLIEFASGYEPSYFGIQAEVNYDLCISKIEVNYLCEQVEGEFITTGEARLYNSETKTFKYTSGNTVLVREDGPLGRETAALENPRGSWYEASNYDPATHSWTTTRDDHIMLTRADSNPFPARKGKNTILVTLMVSKGEGFTGWSGASDVYVGVNRTASETKCQSRFYSQNPSAGAWAHTSLADGFEIYDAETGSAITGPIWDIKVTIEFDISTVADIYNLTLGTSNAYQKFTIYDISFRDNCAHTHLEDYSTGYQFGHKCYRCGKILDRFVDSLSYVHFVGESSSNYTYQTGVTFDNVENCLKTTALVKTNTSEGKWSQNYQLRLNGLIANARAAGLTTIQFKVYLEAAVTTNIRFQWGLWDIAGSTINDFAFFDHWNGPTSGGYTSDLAVEMVTSITNLDGTAAGSNGRPNSAYANKWVIITMDVSSNDYDGLELFISPVTDNNSTGTFPVHAYIADLRLSAVA